MSALVIGIDLGTSGARVVVADEGLKVRGSGAAPLARFGDNPRAPQIWWQAVEVALEAALAGVERAAVVAIAVDGTSGTVLPVDRAGKPLATPLMYNDPVPDGALLAGLAERVPAGSAAHGATSGLAKALHFQSVTGVSRILHQADWIALRLCGVAGSDANNALKTGYDPISGRWPEWIAATGLRPGLLPEVREPGGPVAPLLPAMAVRFGLSPRVLLVAGTTDGCASFLATGADAPGDGVTALGSTLTLKLLSDRPVFAPDFGIYSHKVLGQWLVGGASNSGGKVLAEFFPPEEIARLSARIDPETESGLDYYPLAAPGERFPVHDPCFPPRLEPRPESDADFLKGLFEGMAAIEARGYARLHELGAPALRTLRSVGGGAGNPVWTRIRARRLKVPFLAAPSTEAALGTARLALLGARQAGLLT